MDRPAATDRASVGLAHAAASPANPSRASPKPWLPEGELETLSLIRCPMPRSRWGGGVDSSIADWLATVRDAYETRLVGTHAVVDKPERLYFTEDQITRALTSPQVILGTEGDTFADPVAGDLLPPSRPSPG